MVEVVAQLPEEAAAEDSLELLPRRIADELELEPVQDAGLQLQASRKPSGDDEPGTGQLASPPAGFARRLAFSRKPPGEMPLAHMSAITPTEVLRWPYPRHQEAGR